MVVVDTNILAYLLIEGDRTSDAHALYRRDAEWKSEGFVLIEFSNILATYLRAGALTRVQGQALLAEAETRLRGLVTLPHARALRLAEQFAVSAYDARFLGAAQALGAKLVTEDARLRAAAPAVTMSLADALVS
jgi:predicted nucleic acid-binding protein